MDLMKIILVERARWWGCSLEDSNYNLLWLVERIHPAALKRIAHIIHRQLLYPSYRLLYRGQEGRNTQTFPYAQI